MLMVDLVIWFGMIFQGVLMIVCEYVFDQVVIEKVFVNVNLQLMLLFGQVCGVVICGFVVGGLLVVEYMVLQFKQVVVGYGCVIKMQMQEMVIWLFNLFGQFGFDVVDVFGMVICYVYGGNMFSMLGGFVLVFVQKGLWVWCGRLVG